MGESTTQQQQQQQQYGAIHQLYEPLSNNNSNANDTTNKRKIREANQEVSFLLPTNLSDRPLLLHRDSEFSIGSDYNDAEVHNNLSMWQAAILLTADQMGTGLLALPGDIAVLGKAVGLAFLVANLPLNYYAGIIFHKTATAVEVQQQQENRVYQESRMALLYPGLDNDDDNDDKDYRAINQDTLKSIQSNFSEEADELFKLHSQIHHDTSTFDYIGICDAIFQSKIATRITMLIYYTNIMLVVANYILVAAHGVAAFWGEDQICLATAGLVASVGMLLVSQLRTMARLGRVASIVSLMALLIVILQCLWELHHTNGEGDVVRNNKLSEDREGSFLTLLRKLSALGSIGFACGSQKLFLNIRHELADRSNGPSSLWRSIAIFGTGYVTICWASGSNPPSLLLDAIPTHTYNRHVAGFLVRTTVCACGLWP